MKKLFYVAFLISIVSISSFVIYTKREVYASLFSALDPCKKPIAYRVDFIDRRFNLPREKVIDYTREAAEIWNKSFGRKLFVYSESGQLSVNMVFDSRQQSSNEIGALNKNVDLEKDKLDAMVKKHQEEVAKFKIRLADHNKIVHEWNEKGGAPQDIYEKLISEQSDLERLADLLNQQADSLNLATVDYKLQVGELNKAIVDFNEDLEKKPEEGLYIGEDNRIEIYFNNNRDELIHTLAHEFGHARSLDHNGNPASIMYPYSTLVIELSNEDIRDLEEVCRQRSPIEVVKNRINMRF